MGNGVKKGKEAVRLVGQKGREVSRDIGDRVDKGAEKTEEEDETV